MKKEIKEIIDEFIAMKITMLSIDKIHFGHQMIKYHEGTLGYQRYYLAKLLCDIKIEFWKCFMPKMEG